MRLAIIGSRDFPYRNRRIVWEFLKWLTDNGSEIVIISGGATGPDSWAEKGAKALGLDYRIFRPNRGAYGHSCYAIRNKLIVENCDALVAFWDRRSRGTKQTMDLARASGKLLCVFDIVGEVVEMDDIWTV